MRKKITAFWDLLICSVTSALMLSLTIYIFIVIKGSNGWNDIPWYYTLICALFIAIPFTAMFCLQKITIDLNNDKVNLFYLVNYAKNDKDLHSNWIIYPSQIESIEIVKLSKEEKKKYTSAKFLFNKYLKINLKHGHSKYLYVSHYSNFQIKKIIKILTKSK